MSRGVFLVDGDCRGIERVHRSCHRVNGTQLLRKRGRTPRNVETAWQRPAFGEPCFDAVAHGVPNLDQVLFGDPFAACGSLVAADKFGDRALKVFARREQIIRTRVGAETGGMGPLASRVLYRCRGVGRSFRIVELHEAPADREEAALENFAAVRGKSTQLDGVGMAEFLAVGAKGDGDVIQRQCRCAADERDRPTGAVRKRTHVCGIDCLGIGPFEPGEYRARRTVPAAGGRERAEQVDLDASDGAGALVGEFTGEDGCAEHRADRVR